MIWEEERGLKRPEALPLGKEEGGVLGTILPISAAPLEGRTPKRGQAFSSGLVTGWHQRDVDGAFLEHKPPRSLVT